MEFVPIEDIVKKYNRDSFRSVTLSITCSYFLKAWFILPVLLNHSTNYSNYTKLIVQNRPYQLKDWLLVENNMLDYCPRHVLKI